MESEPKVLSGISAHAWSRAIYAIFGVALFLVVVGAVAIGVHAVSKNRGIGDVALVVGETCAWGVFFSVLAVLALIIAMNLRVRRERKYGYATIQTESDVPFLEQR
ncbi:hypothetical protein [Curtobacterium sp. VKM Ac-1393]|uniref:hypothetical protein n=1 Tax=Curtobacterium sp. VKM Ac-1393 TaxID=2783814 RepID=UPI00188A153F|nr:hypothetical protein [Curtobacterium sp. VKM Ac-1393]MBF4607467.1 hypothetical protein [Curtobacterium sp. VKM Ac-1393]